MNRTVEHEFLGNWELLNFWLALLYFLFFILYYFIAFLDSTPTRLQPSPTPTLSDSNPTLTPNSISISNRRRPSILPIAIAYCAIHVMSCHVMLCYVILALPFCSVVAACRLSILSDIGVFIRFSLIRCHGYS